MSSYLTLYYQTDSTFRVQALDAAGDPAPGGSGTVDILTEAGTSLIGGPQPLFDETGGFYSYAVADTVAISPGDRVKFVVDLTVGGKDTYGEFPAFVKTDRS